MNVEQSIMKLLTSMKNTVHGAIVANVSAKDFKISVRCTIDHALPTCYVQCICGYRISLYYRENRFRIANLSKHLKLNKSKFMTSNKNQQLDNDSKFLNEMILHDEDSEEENAPSFIDNNQSEYPSMDNDDNVLPTSVTNKEM